MGSEMGENRDGEGIKSWTPSGKALRKHPFPDSVDLQRRRAELCLGGQDQH